MTDQLSDQIISSKKKLRNKSKDYVLNFKKIEDFIKKEIEEIEIEEEYDDVDVPFAVIEDVPIYPGCEGVKKSERRNCFQQQINKPVSYTHLTLPTKA